MQVDLVKVKSLGFGTKHCLMVNGIPVMLSGKHKAQSMLRVALNGFSEDEPLSKSEQGYILKAIKTLNSK